LDAPCPSDAMESSARRACATEAPPAGVRLPPSDGADCRELAKLADASLIASRVQSGVLDLLMSCAEPALAAGVALFGLGFLVMPFLVDLTGHSRMYELLSADEFEKRFGPLDLAFMVREICMSDGELDIHTKQSRREDLEREIKDMKKWRQHLTACLRLLQKRAALAFLGLTAEASEGDINKVYKKMALQVHPDKGGDASKFQELQEMRKRIIETEKLPEDDVAEVEDEAMAEEWDPCRERLGMHASVLRLWDSIKKTRAEISNSSGNEAKPQEALKMLCVYIDGFVSSDTGPDQRDDVAEAQTKLEKFISMGAEIITGAALLEPRMSHSVLAMHFDCVRRFCTSPPELQLLCSKVLEAIRAVRARSTEVLEWLDTCPQHLQDLRCQEVLKICQKLEGIVAEERAEGSQLIQVTKSVENRQPADRELPVESEQVEHSSEPAGSSTVSTTPIWSNVEEGKSIVRELKQDHVPIVSWLREKMRLYEAKTTKAVCQPTGRLLLKEPADPDLMTFESPPVQCGDCELRLRMLDRGPLEEVDAALWDGEVQVGSLRGIYIFRQDNFLYICRQASEAVGSCSALLFDSRGCPKPPFKEQVAQKACKGGFLYIDEVQIATQLRGSQLASEFVRTVLKCLAGPMKRVTLAMCTLEAAANVAPQDVESSNGSCSARERYWSDTGFRRAADGEYFFFAGFSADAWHGHRKRLETERSACADAGGAATGQPPLKRPRSIATPLAACPQPQREQLTVAPQQLPSKAAAESAAAAAGNIQGEVKFAAGTRVKYWSQTLQKWITSKILRYNPEDGTYDLDSKRRARPDFIRPSTADQESGRRSLEKPAEESQAGSAPKDDELLEVKQEIERYEQKVKELWRSGGACDLRSPAKKVQCSPAKAGTNAADDELLAVRQEIEKYEQKIKELSQQDSLFDGSYCVSKLTPRMCYVMKHAAKTGLSSLRLDADRFISGKPGSDYWGCKFFPAHLQQVFKSFLKGMANVVSVMIRLLELEEIPTVVSIMQILSPSSGVPGDAVGLHLNKHFVSHFFGMGGKVDHVIRAVIREASLLYNARESDDAEHVHCGDACRNYHDLPIHMLDGDFEYVESLLMHDGCPH